ncbi:MAG: thioredoxin family protein [Rhodospirillaceae bacterium]|nr:thioredoxin family protein [Rhodospirillaceae bacterium]
MLIEKFIRKYLLAAIFSLASVTFSANAWADNHLLPMPATGEDGMHEQVWFHESFLDLSEDLTEAASNNKRLVIFWEQRGCPYCKRMHEVNLRIPKITDSIKDNFLVIRLNLWGDRKVTDFDGEVLKEKDLANKWGVLFTPTLIFYPETVDKIGGKTGKDAEVLRIPGYFKPFHFYFLFKYARTNGYEQEPNFQRWLGGIGDKLDEAGIKYDLYADELPPGLPPEF